LQFSPTAERVIKENKIPESQLKDIIGHGPRGLVMKSDVLEVFLNVPKDKRYHHETTFAVIGQPAGAAPAQAAAKKDVKKEAPKDTGAAFFDIPLTNMRKVRKKKKKEEI
jgi:pyruvate/2-oxoglutarate dehydrogenase complex dihydrolipoamide acyltransferase (E2) component